jgi:hypothetical protein
MPQTRKRKRESRKKRNITRSLRNADQSIQASGRVLNRQQEIASEAIDRAVQQTAAGIRTGGKALAAASRDPEVQKEFAITVEKVADALASVAENSGEITADMVEKFGPAFKEYTFAASDMIQDTIFDGAMGALGAIPVVGDIAATAGQVLDSGNENGWRTFWATFKAVPHMVDIAGKASEDAGESMGIIRGTQAQMGKMSGAISDVAKAIENKAAKAEKAVPKVPKIPTVTPVAKHVAKPVAKHVAKPVTKKRTTIKATPAVKGKLVHPSTTSGGGKRRRTRRRKKSTKKRVRKRKTRKH